ncbi:hypothetical protein ACRALDRAFT_1043971 [Sodiomyces alcalophilus JCM 7366]|uniref:uncharacterized protein n=1 Tax=Sodiomyces alcalophilus JCM 7366 TaxID=591952 RepID=UPI0039B4E02D
MATQQPVKVAIVGAGYVGATTAYALLLNRMAAEIVLIDVDEDRARGEAMDLTHAAAFSHETRVWNGQYEDCAGATVIILTAGANQKPGQTRTQLAETNFNIFKQIVPQVARHASSEAVLVVSANPVDVLTHAAVQLSGFPPHRVMGSGTSLDSARFASELGRHLQIDAASVHAVIIGEHGDAEIPVWSLATVSGMHVRDYCRQAGLDFGDEAMARCFEETKQAAGRIIELKGATGYGIASGLLRIVQAIVRNENTLLPVSCVGSYAGVDDVALSVPRKVNRDGCRDAVPLLLNEEEQKGLTESAQKLRDIIKSLPS